MDITFLKLFIAPCFLWTKKESTQGFKFKNAYKLNIPREKDHSHPLIQKFQQRASSNVKIHASTKVLSYPNTIHNLCKRSNYTSVSNKQRGACSM